ncbi:MAG: hypothetical protein JXR44_02630 [Thiotrichales bacterium]|nr:hypothetical protein [Thiotrichales bacterium]
MQIIAQQKWHPRHWLMPLGMMGTSIMLVFILNVFIPHKGYFLPSITQYQTHIASLDGASQLGLMLAWYGFWLLFILGSLLIPYFIYKSVQFLKAGAHQLSDQDPMETAGWFGIPLSLAMYGNVSAFATIMFFELNGKQDDVLWPFWLAYNTAIALMAFAQFIWYHQNKKALAKSKHPAANNHSMVVPFALGFMGLNLAGPGALGSHNEVVTLSLILSMSFIGLSVAVFFSKFSTFKRDAAALWLKPSDNESAQVNKNWGQILNFGTAITTFNVWMITSVRNYLNYSHNFAGFELATKNMITWGGGITVTLAFLVIITLARRGFFAHLFQAQRPLIFSLGLVCMLVSSFVLTALFGMTALKLGIIEAYSLELYALLTLEAVLLSLNLFVVSALVYRMVLRGNIQCWQTHEIRQLTQSQV